MNKKAQALVESLFVLGFGFLFFFSFIKLSADFMKKLQQEHLETEQQLDRLKIQNAAH
ncbi:MAG: hypothetical protein ACXWQQ_05675 [Pseudobdellovibrio sp.]